jgi:hypothetical protein
MRRALVVAPALAVALLIGFAPRAEAVDPLSSNVERIGGDNTSTGGHVVVQGNRLYMGMYGRGFRMYDITTPASPQFIGEWVPGDLRADAVPDAAIFDGRHIAVLNGTNRTSRSLPPGAGRTDRTAFLDVTNPANPVLLWEFLGANDGEAHNGDIVDVRRWWLPSGAVGNNGLRIYDLNPLLASPPAAPVNLFRGNPVTLWHNSPYRGRKPVGPPFTHTHDITVYTNYPVAGVRRDIALLAEGGNYANPAGNTGSVFVIDITDPRNPVVLLRWLHPTGPDHEPIRYHHEAQFIDGEPRVMLVTDEELEGGCGEAGGAYALRLATNLRSATELSEWFIPAGTPAAVCSVHVFSSEKSRVYFGSYNAGLQIVDYNDPANPQRIGYYVAPGTTAWGALINHGVIYVGDADRGLDVFRYTGP